MDLKTPVLVLHCLGFALGLGGATILDLLLLRSLRRPLDPAESLCFAAIAKIVALALALLWLSGIGFLAIYKWTSPGLLDNPKLWAKVAIVGVLTVNGAYIHARVLPILRSRAGHALFEGMPTRVRISMLTAAAISGVSWYVPFLLGVVREFNFAASAETFLAAYAGALVLAWCLLQLIGVTASTRLEASPPRGSRLLLGADP